MLKPVAVENNTETLVDVMIHVVKLVACVFQTNSLLITV